MVGQHVIIDMFGIDQNKMISINNTDLSIELWNNNLTNIIKKANANCLNISWHNFDRNGAFTSLYLLSESHLSIHTWPEKNYAAVDVFTCGSHTNPKLACEFLINAFQSKQHRVTIVERGI